MDPVTVALPQAAPRPRIERVHAVVNPASGSVGVDAADGLAALMAEHGISFTVDALAPGDFQAPIQRAIDAGPDLLVVLAGDGTARLAAELCGPAGPLLAPLAGGTLNILPHALYGLKSWRDALRETLEHGEPRDVCGGRVGGHAFYVAAILGAPALWAHAREAVRAGDLRRGWRRAAFALSRAFSGDLRYHLERRAGQDAEAVTLISPLISRAVEEDAGLEVAALDIRSATELFRLAFNGVAGDWRRDPGVTVEVARRGRIDASRAIPCILDGETQRLPKRVEFEFTPRAFRALAPRDAAVSNR
jgi:diacylglycerol kinase family enzyme